MSRSRADAAKILIVDDHPLVRDGLAARIGIHLDLAVCGQAAGEKEAIAKVASEHPDLVIVDISLKEGNGIDLIRTVRSRFPAVKMLVVSGYDESLYAERALRAGASGYLHKQQSSEKLIEAMRTVLAGRRYVSEEMAARFMNRALAVPEPFTAATETLSNRELEVFRLIGEGVTTGAIAERLHVSPHTIDTHRENIKRKLRLNTAAELSRAAVQWALENG